MWVILVKTEYFILTFGNSLCGIENQGAELLSSG